MAFPVNEIKLNQNTITTSLFNMIISQRIFDFGVANTELADKFRVDGTLFGDTKLYYSFDIGSPEDWLNDNEAPDLLKLNRNKSGKIQSITMGIYKMIYITTDRYLSKQAFMRDGTFAEYTSFLTGSLRKIKRVYDRALINTKIGTMTPSTPRCNVTITVPEGATIEETNRLEAQTIASKLMVLKADLEDNNRDFNALDYLRAYSPDELIAVWNVEKHAQITKLDLPSIFHNDIEYGGGFKQYDLPEKWFGTPATQGNDLTLPSSAPSSPDGVTHRILVSGWYEVSGTTTMSLVEKPTTTSHYFWAGDAVPYTGQVLKDYARGTSVTVSATQIPWSYYYTVNKDIAFVILHKNALPYMSGFETGTEFYNARSLTSTNFLIFGHNNLEFLEEYPRIVCSVVRA